MSGADGRGYRDIIIIGGGCYGSYYVRQLTRGRAAGRIAFERLRVVDRDAQCTVARAGTPDVELVREEWGDFFARYLPHGDARDAIVPSPLMPHLLYDWLRERARVRWPDREVSTRPLRAMPATPWARSNETGTTYASFATWTCPINCIEPARCPHTRGPRDWTMPDAVRALVSAGGDEGEGLSGPVIFHCTHRAFGVGMIDVADVLDADRTVAAAAATAPADVLVATVSHCHGALNVLHVGAPAR